MVDMIMFYEVLPPAIKKVIPSISFNNKAYKNERGKYEWDTLGYTDPESLDIHIFPSSLRQKYDKRGNIAQNLYHEVGHVLDLNYAKFSGTPGFGLSRTEDWKIARNDDIHHQQDLYLKEHGTLQGFKYELISWYGKTVEEEWAESFSLAMFELMDNKNMAIMENIKHRSISLTQSKRLHPNKITLIKELLYDLYR